MNSEGVRPLAWTDAIDSTVMPRGLTPFKNET